MTTSAANSLLKTLEEPPGDALLILVADRIGRLPATIFSRCQRIDFAAAGRGRGPFLAGPAAAGARWADALRVAGNAPLAAIDALENLDTLAAMSREFAAVGSGRAVAHRGCRALEQARARLRTGLAGAAGAARRAGACRRPRPGAGTGN